MSDKEKLTRDCVVCHAKAGMPCVVASEYHVPPDRTSEAVRRDSPVYVTKPGPHVQR